MVEGQVRHHLRRYCDATEMFLVYEDQLRDAMKACDLEGFRETVEAIQQAYEVLGTIINQLREDGKNE